MKYLVFLSALFFVVLTGCSLDSSVPPATPCQSLAKAFDDHAPFLFTVANVDYQETLVGGRLVHISEPSYFVPEDKEQGKITYALTFKGLEKEEILHLRAHADKPFAYSLGTFYKINLSDIRAFGYLSGSFFDLDMHKLQAMNCPQ